MVPVKLLPEKFIKVRAVIEPIEAGIEPVAPKNAKDKVVNSLTPLESSAQATPAHAASG